MGRLLAVGLGGAVGALGRYGVSLLPLKSAFPVLTLLTNFFGALLIGLIVGLAEDGSWKADTVLFWKTGVCGGFTTFSTFSLEALTLLETGHAAQGAAYAAASVALCVLGVWLGRAAGRMVRG
ncbi:MAG: fluoride efflux transporter CrcB [Eubacteriales bacterium]|nr:fluoride efflux transporter CrcB [Eubacteriales bacterium]